MLPWLQADEILVSAEQCMSTSAGKDHQKPQTAVAMHWLPYDVHDCSDVIINAVTVAVMTLRHFLLLRNCCLLGLLLESFRSAGGLSDVASQAPAGG